MPEPAPAHDFGKRFQIVSQGLKDGARQLAVER